MEIMKTSKLAGGRAPNLHRRAGTGARGAEREREREKRVEPVITGRFKEGSEAKTRARECAGYGKVKSRT